MTNTYLDLLKEQYDKPENAWLAYTLQKNIWKVAVCTDNAPPEVKESIEFQKKINEYCSELTQGNKPDVGKIVFDGKSIIDVLCEKLVHFDFIGLDRATIINLASGMMEIKLLKSSSQIKDWNQLDDLMHQEKITVAPEPSEKIEKAILDTCTKNALTSILVAQCSAQLASIEKIDTSLTQLALVVGCKKEQVGMNCYNIAIDTNIDDDFAGRSSQHFENKAQKLYVKSKAFHIFAHEWLHGMDNIWARHEKNEQSHQSENDTGLIKDLLDESDKYNEKSIQKIKQKLNENALEYCLKAVDRFYKSGYVKNEEELKTYLRDNADVMFKGNFDKKEFDAVLKNYKNPSCPVTFNSYLKTEIELTNHMNKEKLNNSVFLEFAKKMEKNMVADGIKWAHDYSTSKVEKFARLFETYCEVKLNEKKQTNIISTISNNSYTPTVAEVEGYWDKFEKVTAKIKNIIDDICPVMEQKVLSNIEKIRQKSLKESLETVNIKI